MKKKLLLSMAAAMVLSSSLTVCAAPQYMADGAVFDPEWYLEQNTDVASGWSLGTSADAIYQHYTMHGASEGRKPFNEATLDMAGILPYQGTDTSSTTDKTTSTSEQENASVPYKNVPVEGSITYEDTYMGLNIGNSNSGLTMLSNWDIGGKGNGFFRTYRYTFSSGDWVEFSCKDTDANVDGHAYVSDVMDAYGITYREYKQGMNGIIMNYVAAYMAQNPDSNFTSMLQKYGEQFVIVSADVIHDDTYDYDWNCGIIESEPDDCIYMFVNTVWFEDDPDYVANSCINLFEYAGESFIISED